jgi:hypothetical protein
MVEETAMIPKKKKGTVSSHLNDLHTTLAWCTMHRTISLALPVHVPHAFMHLSFGSGFPGNLKRRRVPSRAMAK